MVRRKAAPNDQTADQTLDPQVELAMETPPLTGTDTTAGPIAPEPAPPPPVPAKKGGAMVLGAVLGLAAAGLGYGAALKFPILPQSVQSMDTRAIEDKIAALEAAQAAPQDDGLVARLTALENAPKVDLTTLEARITALEAKISALPDFADLGRELTDIRGKLAQTDPAPAIKAAIAAEMGAVQTTAQEMLASVQEAAQTAAESAAITLLRAALDTGAPFAAAQDLTLPPELAAFADVGIPSLTMLRDGFPDAARLGLDAALRSDLGATWTERARNFLRSQTGARALTPQSGDDPDAVLSRIEAGLRTANMAAVTTEIAALPAPAQKAMADWIALADARAKALAAFAALEQSRGK